MTEGLQDAGALVTAGLAARELERRGGKARHDHAAECANCRTPLVGDFCHACGQPGHIHRTIGAFFHDVGHSVFHFDGKAARTLPMLAWRPGELTRRYVDGERARFVSPMALFLFSVFVMFASLALVTGPVDLNRLTQGREQLVRRLDIEKKTADERVASLTEKLARRTAKGDTRLELDEIRADLAKARGDAVDVGRARAALGNAPAETGMEVNTGSKTLDGKVRHALENPDLAFYKVKSAAYKYSWALIPISLPFIWVLFPFRRGVGLYDHAVFATYSLAFMTLLVTAASMLSWFGVGAPWIPLLALIPPIHLYRQLKGAYRLGRWGALWRTTALLFFTIFTSVMFLLLLLYLGLA